MCWGQIHGVETFREQDYTHTLGNEAPNQGGGKEMDKMSMKVVTKDEFSYQKEATNGLSEALITGCETGRCSLRQEEWQIIPGYRTFPLIVREKAQGTQIKQIIIRFLIYLFLSFQYQMAHNWSFLRSLSPGINNQIYLQTPTQHWASIFQWPGHWDPLLMPSKNHLLCTKFLTDT